MPNTRKRTYNKKRKSSQNKKIARIAKSVLYKNTETKVKMNHINELNLSSTVSGSFYDPMVISEGTGPDERLGNELTLSGYQLKGVLHNNNDSSFQYLRMALFYTTDRAQVTTSSELFINNLQVPLTGATIGGLDLMYHPFNKSKVKVLYDKVHKVAPLGAGNSSGTKFFNMFVKLKNKKITYEHGTSGNAENVSPRLHLGLWTAVSDDDSDAGLELSGMQRLWYKDL